MKYIHNIYIQDVVPADAVEAAAAEFRAWTWIYGKSPKFELEETVSVDAKSFLIHVRKDFKVTIKKVKKSNGRIWSVR